MELTEKIEAAAKLLRCKPDDFIKWREREDGALVVIAGTGQKFIFGTETLEKARQKAPERPGMAEVEAVELNNPPGEVPVELKKAKPEPKPRTAGSKRTKTTRGKLQ